MSSNLPRIEFVKSPSSPVDTAIIALFSDKKLTPAAKTADQMLGGLLQHHLDSNKAFKANEGQTLSFPLSPKAPYLRVILLGVIYLFDMIELLRRASKFEDVPFGVLFEMGLLKVPDMSEVILPFAVLFSAIFTLNDQ